MMVNVSNIMNIITVGSISLNSNKRGKILKEKLMQEGIQ